MSDCSSSRLTMITGMLASFARLTAGLIASVSAGEMAMTSTLRETKSSMMATWSAKAVWVAGERLSTLTLNPAALASLAAFSKNSVAVLNTPVISGGVQPITISSCQRPPPWPVPPSPPRPHAPTSSVMTARSARVLLQRAICTLSPLREPGRPPPTRLPELPLDGGVAAIDDDLRSGHERRLVACHEHNGGGDLLGDAEPPRGPTGGQPAFVRLGVGGGLDGPLHQRGPGGARADRHRADAVGGVVDCDRPGEHQQAGLGHVVGHLPGHRDQAS